jgi:Ni/Fe-hydrogenase subunit HybB-like protein
MKYVVALFLAGTAAAFYRFFTGIGAVSALNDGYPWGIWIAFDVVTGTALAGGGYAVAILCYLFNRGKYHPLVRPAILTSALGYSLANFTIVFDVGRYWNIWKIPAVPWHWNRTSVLLEVALCVMSYLVVLWIELAPAFLEKWAREGEGPLQRFARAATPALDRALPFILALGLLLPTMHQSSLGSLMMMSVGKLHKLWHTPVLPLLFLLTAIAMGYGAVVLESHLSSRAFGRPRETEVLAGISAVMAYLVLAFLAIRLGDVVLRGRIGLAFRMDLPSLFFLLETALFAASAAILLGPERRSRAGSQFRAGMLLILAGALYRFDTYLVAWNPGARFSYFPSLLEQLLTFGAIALEVMGYVYIVRKFPILGGAAAASPESRG